jgi:uncharacterized membrane protein YgcG
LFNLLESQGRDELGIIAEPDALDSKRCHDDLRANANTERDAAHARLGLLRHREWLDRGRAGRIDRAGELLGIDLLLGVTHKVRGELVGRRAKRGVGIAVVEPGRLDVRRDDGDDACVDAARGIDGSGARRGGGVEGGGGSGGDAHHSDFVNSCC